MASTATQPEKAAAAEPYVEVRAPAAKDGFPVADVVLRFLVFASGLVAVLVMVTSKETQVVAQIPIPPFLVRRTAKFNHSPAFIFFVAALSVAGFYGLITTLISLFALRKPGSHTRLISHFIILDVLLLGIVAAATGAAGGVGYIGLKGNKYVQWNKICHVYGDFCRHVGASVFVSLFGSVVLALLILLSVRSLSKKIPRHNH
ncbi:CASP-like protein 1 [Salvia miltiorrhiza]|uniref:CASP-like protein 1 n=1 Tax=Salvia miltiorrhiza TaxID=226208 RepID=UPI0025AD4064|nr:CASP-like protein 1 [Salvia miltiorrhiza]